MLVLSLCSRVVRRPNMGLLTDEARACTIHHRGMTRNDGNDPAGAGGRCSGASPSRGASVQDEDEDEDNIVRGENLWPAARPSLRARAAPRPCG
jgi:hypothetical protein